MCTYSASLGSTRLLFKGVIPVYTLRRRARVSLTLLPMISIKILSVFFLVGGQSNVVSDCSVNFASNEAECFLLFDCSDFFCKLPVHIFSPFLSGDF